MHLGPPLLPRREGLSSPPSDMLATLTLATTGEEEVDMILEPLSTMALDAGEEGEVDTSLETSIDQVTNGAHLYSLLEAQSMKLALG